MPGFRSAHDLDRITDMWWRLLCEASIDIVIDLGNLVVGMDGDGRGFLLRDARKGGHGAARVSRVNDKSGKNNFWERADATALEVQETCPRSCRG
jgi:hypothetical protein